MAKEQTLYEILRVKQDATLEEIKRAYRQRALEYHPDINSNSPSCHEVMCQINNAYSILRNIETRMRYDELLKSQGKYYVNPDEESKQESASTTQTDPSEPKSDNQNQTYKKTSYSYETEDQKTERYNYYNTQDFASYEQEEFIEWIQDFFHEYIEWAINCPKNDTNILQKIKELYDNFVGLISIEKSYSKKRTMTNRR